MANSLYDKARESFLKGDFAVHSQNIKVALCDATYSANLATDQFLSDIPGASIIATSSNLSSKTTAAGVFDAADVLFSAVPAGSPGTQLILYQDTGTGSTSRLIGKIDVGTNLPVTPNGGDINCAWSNGASRIYKL